MQKITITALTLIFSIFGMIAQNIDNPIKNYQKKQPQQKIDSPWKYFGQARLSITNEGLGNWSGGGETGGPSALSLFTFLNVNAVKETDKMVWDNYGMFAYGFTNFLEDNDKKAKTTDDMLLVGSRYGIKFKQNWSYAANIELRTQFAPFRYFQNDNSIREEERKANFLAPGYLNIGLGYLYKKPGLTLSLTPLTSRTTLVLDKDLSNIGAFGVSPGDKALFELGPNVTLNYSQKIIKNVTYNTLLNLFSGYNNKFGNIDVSFESLIVFEVNKYINFNFMVLFYYDDDYIQRQENGSYKPQLRSKDVLNLSVSYNF